MTTRLDTAAKIVATAAKNDPSLYRALVEMILESGEIRVDDTDTEGTVWNKAVWLAERYGLDPNLIHSHLQSEWEWVTATV